MNHISISGRERESNTSWALKVKHVGLLVPWLFIHGDHVGVIIVTKRSILLHESKKGWAARASIKPDEYWVSCWVILRLNKDVVKLLGSSICGIQIAWVRISRHSDGVITIGQRGKFLFCRLGRDTS
jgi:hypothetical protein